IKVINLKIIGRGIYNMGIKKQLGIGVASAASGLTSISGGTYAYFSSSETSNNTYAAGHLDLTMEPTEVVDVEDMKPGDTVTKDFELSNSGTLDIEKILLETDYSVIDAEGDNTDDFGKHIQEELLYNTE